MNAPTLCRLARKAFPLMTAATRAEAEELIAVLEKRTANARKGGFKGQLMPTELRTAELDTLPVWIRERSFFMAGVNRVEVLEEFDERVQRIAEGKLTVQEAREELRGALDALGYEAKPGEEGTIKDLRSVRRMTVALETNVAMIHGYERWLRQQEALVAFPAQKFVRLRLAKEPRKNWPQRFAEAVGETTAEGANVEEMAALVNHPCWAKLSRFGTPYAPFDFGSGMGLLPISRMDAAELGLMPMLASDPEHERMMEPQVRSFNESLEARPAITEQAFRDAVAEYLQGFAEWDGKRLVFTDPNGTRPYTAEALALLWQRPLPAAFADLPGGGHVQREAFFEWVRTNKQFADAGHKNYYGDLLRVLTRLRPSGREKQEMFRALSFATSKKLGDFLAKLEREGYAVRPEYPAESWAGSFSAARKYAAANPYQIILRLPHGHSSARDVSPITRAFAREIAEGAAPYGKLVATDDEILLPRWARLSVKAIRHIQETPEGALVEILLEEVS